MRRCVLLPVGWETHSSPTLAGRPQSIITDRVLQDCDLLVGVFWTRLGTPTGEAASGTVEEIERHHAAGKPVMVYFSDRPAAPQSIDAAQYEAVREFRRWCKNQGLIHTFEDSIEFQDDFRRHLQITLQDDPYLNGLLRSGVSQLNGTPLALDEKEIGQEANELIAEAAKDNNGTILVMSFLNGDAIQTNNVNFASGADARKLAAWRNAVHQLASLSLIEDRNGRGEIYYVTDTGFRYAESLV